MHLDYRNKQPAKKVQPFKTAQIRKPQFKGKVVDMLKKGVTSGAFFGGGIRSVGRKAISMASKATRSTIEGLTTKQLQLMRRAREENRLLTDKERFYFKGRANVIGRLKKRMLNE